MSDSWDPLVYQAIVLSKALELYKSHKIKASRLYTPRNMMNTASSITGKKYAPRDYLKAAADLKEWANKRRFPNG